MSNYISYRPQFDNEYQQQKWRILEKIGLYVEGETKVRCPVDTGNLRNSYDHEVNRDKESVTIGTNVEYAIFVEKGTSRQRAQPHLEPAVRDNRRAIQRIAERG